MPHNEDFIPGDPSDYTLEMAVDDLFDYAGYLQVKACLWDWLKATVCGNYNSELEEHERVSLLMLYEKISILIDAANERHKEIREKRKAAFK